jgi:hypothetical protein
MGIEVDVLIIGAGPVGLYAAYYAGFPPRPLPVGGDFEGRGLSYFVPEPAEYVGKDVVTLVHRRDNFRAHEHSVRKLGMCPVEAIANDRSATPDRVPQTRQCSFLLRETTRPRRAGRQSRRRRQDRTISVDTSSISALPRDARKTTEQETR